MMCIALRTLPHVVAADGGYQHVKSQFRVGDVSVKYNGKKIAGTILQGSTAEVGQVTDLNFLQGRLFTDEEDQRAAHVCVLGHDTWENCSAKQNAIGKEVNVETGLYTVIGVLDKQKQPFGGGKNPGRQHGLLSARNISQPASRRQRHVGQREIRRPQEQVARRRRDSRDAAHPRAKCKVEKPDNFEIFGPDSLSKLWDQLTGGLVLFMIAVSSVGLMVGGVGVMNIMLVSVTERTREIGVRKAIGATKRTLLTQFTTEAVTLCAVGGIIGILLGAILTWIVYFLPIGLPATLSTMWVLMGFGVSCAIGLIFGIYPAWKAANLDPIEALRYE